MQQRAAGPELPHSGDHRSDAAEVVVVLSRLEGDVVAEPLRLLVGVRVAADVDEQRRVVDRRTLRLVETEPVG